MEEGQLEASNLPPEIWHSEVTVSMTGEPLTAVEENEETAKETAVEIIPEVMEPLSFLDVLRISAVLEDTTDQLSILNYIMPVQYEKRKSISVENNKEIHLEGKSLEKLSLVSKPAKISSPFVHKEEPKLPEIRHGGQFNKVQDLIFKKPTRQTIMNTETLKKIQIDRQFFSDVITETMQELQDSGTFTNLLKALGKERENKMHFCNIIAREKNGRKKIKSLQKQLFNIKRERQAEVQSRHEYIAHLKDQLREMKAKTNMENRYMKRNTELQISQTQKKCSKTEELLLEEIEKLRLKTEEEKRIHAEIEIFLRKEQQIREYEQVIIEDRIKKEKTRKKIEQDHLELKSIIKLQAWWRGTVVRKEIGGFKMPKKDKDDGKDSKGKGKGKDKDKRRGKK
ncbi:dynein regulatory complex protein 9 isoform X2 [Mesoplodon densirostris]|uniref:dynein regulatory complex protein 9 isoform X2 n=1 Tax=Mesoplodon densirostris TaxID=48708 RepID=UPI0028DBE58C|nr:dynein regulatory complex protein 9 isoform X2 [Mesoplodon densirostris]